MRIYICAGAVALALLGGLAFLFLEYLSSEPGEDPPALRSPAEAARSEGLQPLPGQPNPSRAGSSNAAQGPGDSRARYSEGGARTGRPPGAAAKGDKASTPEKDLRGRQPIPRGQSDLIVETVSPSGEPLSGISVNLRSGRAETETETDREGEAVFSGIAAGVYTLRILAPEGPELVSARQILLDDREERRIALRLGDADLSISGRVLNRAGAPVPGITVEAVSYLFQVDDSRFVPRDQSSQRAASDADGFFEIQSLLEGEYEVRTVATDTYLSDKTIVRAGVDSVELRVTRLQVLRVFGRTVTPDGNPLSGVLVNPVGQVSQQTSSGRDGSYSLELALTGKNRVYSLMFSLEGFRNLRVNLGGDEVLEAATGKGELEVDAELEPIGVTAPVSGVLTAADSGEPVAGETIYLHSPSLNARYIAVSDEEGGFLFPDVQVAEDYRLWINPKGHFRDFVEHPVSVTRRGVERVIELDPLATGRVQGEIVDSVGRPLPHFSIWLRSIHAVASWLKVAADEKGRFVVDDAPAGNLLFDTRSPPRLRAQGLKLEADREVDVRLVMDWGELQVEGTVVDERGQALPGVRVEFHWSHSEKGILSSSIRRSVTDEDGVFRFSQLASGLHQLKASFPGYKTYQTNYDVGSRTADPTIRVQLKSEG